MAGSSEAPAPAPARVLVLRQGGETGQRLGSSPGRMGEEKEPMSPRAWSLSSSSTSSLASDVESDDGDAGYPLTQCEYEEIPSFRWIATPLRWWKTKKKSTPSRTKQMVRTRDIRVAFFDDRPIFTAKDLLRAPTSEYLGTGAYGSLHKATLRDGHQLAMRRLSCATAENFEAEAHALGKIRHPNILALRAYCTWPQGQKALVFDYKPRGSLSAFLQFYSAPADAISSPERMKMAIGIARGLHHLHTRCSIVHGNLTSRNILLDDEDGGGGGGGGHGTVKIADYGLPHLAVSVFGSDRTAAGGAPEYRAPELPMLEKPNVKTDVYSLGVIILELLTGSSPKKAKEDHRMPVWKASMKLRIALASTWCLAWRCVDGSPDARPDALDVLRQLEDIAARSLGYRATGRDIGDETAGDAVKAGRSEVKSAGGATAGSSPTTTAAAIPTTGFDTTSLEMAKEGASKDSQGNLEGGQISNPTPAQEILIMQAQHSGDAYADHVQHSKDRSASETEEFASAESVAPDEVTNSPTSQLEGDQDAITYELSGQDHQSAESKRRTDGLTGHDMSSGSGAGIVNPLSSIDWSKLESMEVELQVPSASPLISSEPDLIYQSYFLTLHKLGHTSPPLPFDLLEDHVNRMVVGLRSMGYPLDAWTKAATLLLVSAKKREYIEHCVEDYKAQLEVQDEEFTSAITLAKENISRIQSNLSAVEQRNQELDETIAELVAYLAGLKLEHEKMVNELTTARDLLATAEAEAESISMDMDRVKQQRSATSLLRDDMLQQLPPLDEVFDSAFQQIMDKKF